MARAVRRAEANAPRIGRLPYRAGEDELVETEQALALAECALRCLHRERSTRSGPGSGRGRPGPRQAQRAGPGRRPARRGRGTCRAAGRRHCPRSGPADVRRLPTRRRAAPRRGSRRRAGDPRVRSIGRACRACRPRGVLVELRERARRRAGRQRTGEVDLVQVVLVLDLQPEEPLRARLRGREVHLPPARSSAVGTLDEEQAGGAERRKLLAQMRLEARREEAAAEQVA